MQSLLIWRSYGRTDGRTDRQTENNSHVFFSFSHAQYTSHSLWVCCLRPWLVIGLQINSQQLVFAAAIYPLRLTDICAAHLSCRFSCIHQSGVGGEAPRITGMLEEACRTDALLRGIVTLNITQPSPIGTRGKISCQPGEWLLVYGQWEVGKSLMVLWDGLWLFPPALLQSLALSVTLPLLSLLPFLNGRRASMEKRKAEFCWMIKSLKWLLCKNNKNKRKRRGKKRWQGESLSHKRGLNKINKATSKH